VMDAVLAGSTSLMISCGEVLLERGHRVLAVVSRETAVTAWAEEAGITVVDAFAHLEAELSGRGFDYLFSIANFDIVPDVVLRLAHRGAVNFHGGPLPRYAGLNATAWAIINGETSHGVTWHLMTGGVDEGDVLKQQAVPIEPGDTAYVLNLAVYDAAIESFESMIADFELGRTRPRPQDLAQRTYFGKHQRPSAVIDWSMSAESIDALARGLDFGPYPNPLTVPKIRIGQEVFLVPAIRGERGKTSLPPGTVLEASNELLRISVTGGEVLVREVLSYCGEPLQLAHVVASCGLSLGRRLDGPVPAESERILALSSEASRFERFWAAELSSLLPAVPLVAASLPDRGNERVSRPVDLPRTVLQRLCSMSWDGRFSLLAAGLALAMARLNGDNVAAICVRPAGAAERYGGLPRYFAQDLPVCVRLDSFGDLPDSLRRIEEKVGEIVRSRGAFPWDLLVRYPSLKPLAGWAARGMAGAAVVQSTHEALGAPASGHALALVVGEDELAWNAAATDFDPAAITALERALGSLLFHDLRCSSLILTG
jgi:methionyl-tRNA formyltransferase